MAGYTKRAVAVQVARTIEQEIASNRMEPGDLIGRRRELAETYEVAPATLSEAIQLLRSRGLVDAKPGPGGGIFVAVASPFARLSDELLKLQDLPATLNDSFRVLDALDGVVLLDAVEHAGDSDRRQVREAAETLSAQWNTNRREQRIWDLHRRIARISPNELLRSLYLNLVGYITDRYANHSTAPATELRLTTHLDFATAVIDGDMDLARKAIRMHRNDAEHDDKDVAPPA